MGQNCFILLMDIHLGMPTYTSMMADGAWGDHVVLHGAANCFRTCIHVISSLPHSYDVMVCPEFDVTSSNRLVLGHLHELHYVSLIPQIGGKDV